MDIYFFYNSNKKSVVKYYAKSRVKKKACKEKSLTQQSIQITRTLGNPLITVCKMSLTLPHVDGSPFSLLYNINRIS